MSSTIQFPKEISSQVLEAMHFYPELQHAQIRLVYCNIKTTMAARPTILSLFQKQRQYIIYINNKKANHFGILFNDVPHKAQVGLLSHELAHILDYEHKTFWQIAKTGFLYLFKRYRQAYEKEIDVITVQHGAGWHLCEYTRFIFESPLVSDKYKAFIKKYYLQADDIETLIASSQK